jgi:competence protein ComEA
MKTAWLLAFGLAAGLLAAGVLFLVTRPPRGSPVTLLPPPTPPALEVHITGAVRNPGVYTLPPGSRVHAVLEAAGGPTGAADLDALNLAAYLADGEQLRVPTLAEATTQAFTLSTGLVDLNSANQAELESLPGIGPTMAERIIAYRQEHGPFLYIEDVMAVEGIGEGIFAKIKEQITVEVP